MGDNPSKYCNLQWGIIHTLQARSLGARYLTNHLFNLMTVALHNNNNNNNNFIDLKSKH
jgi:hypothetical protein